MSRGVAPVSIPLSTLRPDFAGGWPLGSRWTIPEATAGGAVEQPENSVLAFRLRAAGGRLRGSVRLLPGDLHPSGAVRARVVIQGQDRRELWSGFLGSVLGHRRSAGLELDVALPAGEDFDLLLCASRLKPFGKGGSRLRWEDPRIEFDGPLPEAEERIAVPAPAASAAPPRDPAKPLFSILTPVHNPPHDVLEEMLESVREQSFPDWEMRLVDDGSTDPEVMRIMERFSASDGRMHVIRSEQAGGISAATNRALEAAEGEYIALLDHDDLLAEDALETVAALLAERPELDMVYSDEDVFDEEGARLALFVKPYWSPDLMRSHMYTCHLGVYRRSLAERVGGFRPEFDGSQDYDFVLRISEQSDRIAHIPKVLYHWRSHVGSVAENLAAKPHAFAAARRAIADHVDRLGIEAEVHFDAKRCWYRVDYKADPTMATGLVLPLTSTDDAMPAALRRAVEAWSSSAEDSRWELVLAGPEAALQGCAKALQGVIDEDRLHLVSCPGGSGRAAILNRAVAKTSAERLLLLDGPVEQLTSNWLARLESLIGQDDIGAVAAKTLAADGRVEHAGVVLRDGFPAPVQLAADQLEPGPMAVLYVRGNFWSASGTVMTSRGIFERLGGLDERFDQLAVTDYCGRAWAAGLRVLSAPDAVVRRTDRTAPVNDLWELLRFAARWRVAVPEDPYFGRRAAAVLTGVGQAN